LPAANIRYLLAVQAAAGDLITRQTASGTVASKPSASLKRRQSDVI
jgi:hypothetical protein